MQQNEKPPYDDERQDPAAKAVGDRDRERRVEEHLPGRTLKAPFVHQLRCKLTCRPGRLQFLPQKKPAIKFETSKSNQIAFFKNRT